MISAIFQMICHSTLKLDFVLDFHSLPWDCETAIGYFGEIAFHLVAGQGYSFFNAALVLLFIAISLNHQAFRKIHQNWLQRFNKVDNRRNNKKHLCKIIKFEIMIKRYVGFSLNMFYINFA